MNLPDDKKFVPGLPADDDINTPTNSQGDNSVKIYDGVAECTMNDSDSLKSVKLRAKDLAIQKVKQKIADYVYGFWKDRYLTLPDDEVLSIVKEISNITDVNYNVLDSEDKIVIRATANAQINDNDIMNCLINFLKERIELKSQIEALRKKNDNLKHQNDNIDIAINKFFEAENAQSHKEAIKLYSKAIQLYPNFAYAYSKRGWSYERIGDDEKAKADYAKYRELRRN